MACALSPDTDVDAVYAMPHAEKVEHPAQLAGATRVVYTLEGDESPKPEPGASTKKKKNSKATSVKTMKSNDAPVYNPRPNTAPPSRLRPPTRKTQYGFGGVVPFAGKEYLPSAMASAAKSSSKKAATLQAYQLELGDSYDGLVTSAITPRSSAEKLLVNNPMGLQHRRPRPESARVTGEQTPGGSKEDESIHQSVGHFDLRASFERGGSISIPALTGPDAGEGAVGSERRVDGREHVAGEERGGGVGVGGVSRKKRVAEPGVETHRGARVRPRARVLAR